MNLASRSGVTMIITKDADRRVAAHPVRRQFLWYLGRWIQLQASQFFIFAGRNRGHVKSDAGVRLSSGNWHVVLLSGTPGTPLHLVPSFNFGESLPRLLFSLLLHQDEANGHEDKIKDQQLRSLAIRSAYITHQDRIGKSKQRGENQDRRHLP